MNEMKQLAISDSALVNLEQEGAQVLLYDEGPPLLRRFGSIEFLIQSLGESQKFRLRNNADEVLLALRGECRVQMIDTRRGSPSRATRALVTLGQVRPQALLIPFGVAYAYEQSDGCILVRLCTHRDSQTAPVVILSPEAVDEMVGDEK